MPGSLRVALSFGKLNFLLLLLLLWFGWFSASLNLIVVISFELICYNFESMNRSKNVYLRSILIESNLLAAFWIGLSSISMHTVHWMRWIESFNHVALHQNVVCETPPAVCSWLRLASVTERLLAGAWNYLSDDYTIISLWWWWWDATTMRMRCQRFTHLRCTLSLNRWCFSWKTDYLANVYTYKWGGHLTTFQKCLTMYKTGTQNREYATNSWEHTRRVKLNWSEDNEQFLRGC